MIGHLVKRALEAKKIKDRQRSVQNKVCRFCKDKAVVGYVIGDKVLLTCNLHGGSIIYFDKKVVL